MHRIIVKPGQLPLDLDHLQSERFAHTGLGRFIQAVMGPVPVVDGMAVTATTPASMQVKVGAGSLMLLGQVDPSAYGTLSPDTRALMRLGELESDTLLTLTAPGVFGQSINYLIQATFAEIDDTPLVRAYYNEDDPDAPFSGPENSGVTDFTVRRAKCVVNAKAGVAATTGTQVTPAPDAGYYPLYVVSVAFGATTIISPNIAAYGMYPASPYLLSKLPDVPANVQSGIWVFGQDIGTANALSVKLTPSGVVPPRLLIVKAAATNTGAASITIDGLSAIPILQGSGDPLAAGMIRINQVCGLLYDGANYQLIQAAVAPAAAPPHGFQKYDVAGVYTFTVPDNVTTLFVKVWGAGGAGGDAYAPGTTGNTGGGGGAGGGFAYKRVTVTPGQQITVTIGAGGTRVPGGTGNTGGTSSFGAYCSATGGPGGINGSNSALGAPSSSYGGVGSGGDLNLYGSAGHPAVPVTPAVAYSAGGLGGMAPGLAFTGGNTYGAGVTGKNGAGGTGGGASNTTATAGANGGDGLATIEW